MKIRRIISLVVCFAIIICISLPLNPVNAASVASLDNVVTAGNYSAYVYENSSFRFCIFLNCQSGAGSFALIKSSSPDYVHEYLFSLSQSSIDTASTLFWENIISDCFKHSDQWCSQYVPGTITSSTDLGNAELNATTDAHKEYFEDWLYDLVGPKRTDYLAGDYMEGYVLFSLYETVNYSANRCNTHKIKQAISVATFITGILGKVPSLALLGLLGEIANVVGTLLPGTVVGQYQLTCTHDKYITTKGGSLKYATAYHVFEYDGYTNDSTNFHAVDEGSRWDAYTPSEDAFSTSALLDAAFAKYLSYLN